jgi:hypothetical protein
MKIRSVSFNNHRKAFEVRTPRGDYSFPYAKLEVQPGPDDRITTVYIDREIASEGFTYVLESGREDTVHIDQVLDYNRDPEHMRELLLYELSLEAQRRVKESPLSKREIIRRLGTSPAQFYRLLDQTNTRKSIDRMLLLLRVLDCEVEIVVRAKSA